VTLQSVTPPHSATSSKTGEPSRETVARHVAGSGELWNGSRTHVKKALDLFMSSGEPNFPLTDVMKEARVAVATLRKVMETCEKEAPERPSTAWGMQCILLTGGTGFIGIHFLEKLLHAYPEARICCLVRGGSPGHCMERLHASAKQLLLDDVIGEAWNRVVGVPGDITTPNMGMKRADYEELVSSVETVVHLAAKDNFFLPFEVLRKPHVDGVINVVKFCASCKVKSLMHMSSCKVRLIQQLQGKIVPNDGLYDGYAQSKYVGHCLAEEVASMEGKMHCAPPMALVNLAYVHKYNSPPVVPDITDAWEVVMKVCLDKGVVPDIDVPMDFLPIGYATDCLVEILDDRAAGRLDGHTWCEIFSPDGLNFGDVIAAMQSSAGTALKTIPMAEFARHWHEVLWKAGNFPSKCLSIGVTSTFVNQTTTVFSVGPNLYHSRKHDPPPKMSKEYLLDLMWPVLLSNPMLGAQI